MKDQEQHPNLFIVGAHKCGTTALSLYLGDHPDIFITTPKEPFYFATDYPGLRLHKTEADYLAMYRDARPGTAVLGEASAGYLLSSEAIANIREFNKDAKIIVMLRNPIDLVYSFHSQLLFGFEEDEKDFTKAWSLQEERRAGRRIPPRALNPKYLQYRELGRLGAQVQRVLDHFPRDQVLFHFFEDFVAETGAVYRQTLKFLGLPDDGRTSFPRVNPQKQHRFPWLMGLLSRRPRWLEKGIDRLKAAIGPGGVNAVRSLYATHDERVPLPDALREEMRQLYLEDIARLEKLTGRDLSKWKKPRTVKS